MVTKVVGAWPQPDGVTLEEVDGVLRVKDNGITSAKILDGTISIADLSFKTLEKIDEAYASSAVTQLSLTVDDFTGEDIFLLVGYIVNPSTSYERPYYIRFNNDGSTAYQATRIYYEGDSLGASQTATLGYGILMGKANVSEEFMFYALIYASSSKIFRALGSYISNSNFGVFGGFYTGTAITSLSSIQVYCYVADQVGAGSRATLYRLHR